MTYSVKLSPHAARQYSKLDPSMTPRLKAALDTVQHRPLTGPKVKRLKGRLHEYYRYREGDYRIVYTVAQRDRTVYVDYIQHRKDAYRRD